MSLCLVLAKLGAFIHGWVLFMSLRPSSYGLGNKLPVRHRERATSLPKDPGLLVVFFAQRMLRFANVKTAIVPTAVEVRDCNSRRLLVIYVVYHVYNT